jgi:TolA-binding protein
MGLYDRALKSAPSKLDASLATLGLGTCLQALGKSEEAAKRMTAHLGKCDPAVLPEMLLAIRTRETLNRIVSEFGDTEYAQKARQALAELPRTGA